MTRPDSLDDMQLDQLLGAHRAPPLPADFAQRVAAEAMREDRTLSLPPFPPQTRRVHRPWARRGLVAGLVAVNLIVASAIAATFSGHFPALQHVAATMARVLHIPRHHATPYPPHMAHDAPRHREAAIVAPPPAPPEAITPAQIFTERHPLLTMRREGLLPSRPLAQQRSAILFAERHPLAAHALMHRARMRALRAADAVQPAPLREERPALGRMPAEKPAIADTLRTKAQAGLRARLDDRAAFERERRELEQRANAEWPAKPAEAREKPEEARERPHDRPAVTERKAAHPGAVHPKWRERMKRRRQGLPGQRRAL